MTDIVGETAEATSFAQKAVHLGGDDAVPLCMGAYALAAANFGLCGKQCACCASGISTAGRWVSA